MLDAGLEFVLVSTGLPAWLLATIVARDPSLRAGLARAAGVAPKHLDVEMFTTLVCESCPAIATCYAIAAIPGMLLVDMVDGRPQLLLVENGERQLASPVFARTAAGWEALAVQHGFIIEKGAGRRCAA